MSRPGARTGAARADGVTALHAPRQRFPARSATAAGVPGRPPLLHRGFVDVRGHARRTESAAPRLKSAGHGTQSGKVTCAENGRRRGARRGRWPAPRGFSRGGKRQAVRGHLSRASDSVEGNSDCPREPAEAPCPNPIGLYSNHVQSYFLKPSSSARSLKHLRHMFRPYCRMTPRLRVQTRQPRWKDPLALPRGCLGTKSTGIEKGGHNRQQPPTNLL